jgi:uncharacterized surface protein with fasciclin (FAS1) repeats
MTTKLLIYLVTVIFTVLLTCRSVQVEALLRKRTSKIAFYTPPVLQSDSIPEYKTWFQLHNIESGDSTANEETFTVLKQHPVLKSFYNAISKVMDLKSIGTPANDRRYTVFAPIVIESSYWDNLEDLEQTIRYHVHVGEKYDLGRLDTQFKYLVGENGPIVHKLQSGYIQVDCALIVSKPIITANGVIYPISRALDPRHGAVYLAALQAGRIPPC